MKYLVIYLLVINIVAFALMGIDKSRARNGQWRISEASLFLSAILGGSIGSIAGMQLFRHKTKHWYFQFGIPAILMIQLILAFFLFRSPG
ncbi:MAG: DUF1294 domain-containing protein [Oscillospiraceae bacterium]|nr:DUF1294 domain-containing protein [Oscillospiraceae bacterium]